MQYALPVWGPSLYHQYLQCLQILQNHAVCLIFSLNKFNHVSKHYEQLQWLGLDQYIRFCLICVMFHQYHNSQAILLQPPIATVWEPHRAQPHFTNLNRC